MGVFVRHEPCPNCGSKDNLARYDDGSAHCFGKCGYNERSDRVPLFVTKEEDHERSVQLDVDLCSDFPGHVVEWLAKYGISVQEALRHEWKYSPSRNQLVFIFRDKQGTVLATQARNFSPTKTKYYNQGPMDDILAVIHPPVDSRELVLVEDVVSAAKISRQVAAMPLLGSGISKAKLRRLRVFYDLLYVWLDADKLNEARAIADQAKWLGFGTRVLYTPLDPKEYNDVEIAETVK